jgi:arginine deiminase
MQKMEILMSKFYVNSEVGQLKKVLLHRPELSIKRLTPSNCDDLLFDGVLWVDRAQEEHDVFANSLRDRGVEVFYVENLLRETLKDEKAREYIVNTIITKDKYGRIFSEILREYLLTKCDEATLTSHLIGGLTKKEFKHTNKRLLCETMGDWDFIITPLPNHLYTRDTSCWVYNGVSINGMATPARSRESVNLAAIYNHHPMFKDDDFSIYGNVDDLYIKNKAAVEGGDVLVLGKGIVMIGMGERTEPQGVENLALRLFNSGKVKKIIAVKVPSKRAFMHLDTLMTMVNEDTFCVFPNLNKIVEVWNVVPDNDLGLHVEPAGDLFEAVAKALDLPKLNLIYTDLGNIIAEREQWDDGNNLLAISPNVVIGYDRNTEINKKLTDAGVDLIKIPGSELGRGRGGARCMSCPLQREGI